MDPLVRAAVGAQQFLFRTTGFALSALGGAYVVWWARRGEMDAYAYGVFALLGATLVHRLVRRLRRLNPVEIARLDLELFCHLVVGAYAVVLNTPGRIDGPYYAVIYLVMMFAAAFARPAAAIGTVVFAIGMSTAIGHFAFGRAPGDLWPRAVMLAMFAVLNMIVFRAEISRVRRLSKSRIEGEIQKMKDAARSYRLLGAPSSAVESRARPSLRDAEERVLQSGVEEIHQAIQFALDLLRRSLGLRTAVLLRLMDASGRMRIEEISTDEDAVDPGPYRAQDGIFAAALTRGETVSVSGRAASRHVPYYAGSPKVTAVCVAPLTESGHSHGLLVVDRDGEPFGENEEALLAEATRFIHRAIQNERVFVQLERAKIEQGKLYRAADVLAAATTEAQVIEAGVSSAREFASFDFAVVTLFDRTTGEHEICAASGTGADAIVGQRFRHNSGLVSMVVANRHPLPYRGDYDSERQVVFTRRLSPPPMPSLLVLPLLVHDKALGTLVLGSERRSAFGEAVRPTLEVLASHMAVSLANARMLKRLEELATTDGLTSLLNKRALMQIGMQKLRSAERFEKPLSLLICDIDHFKKVNDTYGHDVGDVVIRGLGKILKRNKRDTDVVGRFGGEEFVVVCEETDDQGAILLAERIRTELEATTFRPESHALKVTCSIGVATVPGAGRDWETSFKAADEALYVSKRSGRNRTTVWSTSMRGCAA